MGIGRWLWWWGLRRAGRARWRFSWLADLVGISAGRSSAAIRWQCIGRWRFGNTKPSFEERRQVPHHLIDVAWPDEACTAGDYSRLGREALEGIVERGNVPIVAGGTGLYLRALIDGLFCGSPRQPELREKLRAKAAERGAGYFAQDAGAAGWGGGESDPQQRCAEGGEGDRGESGGEGTADGAMAEGTGCADGVSDFEAGADPP